MKRFKRRAISILLAAMMILSSLPMGITAFATVSSTTASSVYVVVPETIYLTPSTSGATTSQYFVNNTFDSSSNSITLDAVNNATTGKIYFKNTDAEKVTITATISQGSGTASVSGMTLGSAYTLSSGYGAYTISKVTLSSGVTAGSSAQIKWTFTATLSDGTTDTYYAYTTCYSPYYTPVAAAASETRTNGVAIQGVSWISGIHGINSSYDYNEYGVQTTVNLTYLSPLLGNLVTTAGDAQNYTGNTTISGSTYSSVNATNYVQTTNDANNAENVASSYTGILYVDTDRNTTLSTIPNFTVGFLVSNVNKAGTLYYYVSDFTSEMTSYSSSYYNYCHGVSGQSSTLFFINDGEIFYGSLEDTKESVSANTSKLVYNSTWDKSLTSLTTSATYAVKGAARLLGSNSSAYINCMSFVNVVRVYKTDLRNQIETCTESGWQENWCADSSAWSTYQTALQNAYYYLGKPDATSTEVTNAYNTLKTAYEALTKKDAKTVTVNYYALTRVLDENGDTDSYTVTALYTDVNKGTTVPADTVTVEYGQNYTATADEYTGYTYAGYIIGTGSNVASTGTSLTEEPTYDSTNASLALIRSDDGYSFNYTTINFYYTSDITLEFILDGGSISCNTIIYGSPSTTFTVPTPTKTGYTFTEWTLSPPSVGNLNGSVYTFGKKSVTLTAGWEIESYDVDFVAEDGNALCATQTVEYGSSATPPETPTKDYDYTYHYTFAGWVGDNSTD
ncbi:MAG: InlB B-repeat-containing protein, partial [Clostridiales bacterium]|nr:InlB B-repeat-containing protein [Clostridiales bacterium]